MLSLCYTQRSGYLLHTMFPSLNILQYYAKFDTHTIATLEKLFSARSFGGSIGLLVIIRSFFLFLWVSLASLPWFKLLPHILGVLDINHSYTCHFFLIGWSPYSSRCSSTCWDRHFPISDGTTRCLNHVTPRCPLSCVPPFESLVVQFYPQL